MSAATSNNSSSSANTAHAQNSNANHHHQHPANAARPSSSSSSAQPTHACAACKYQRRKCNPDCTLAPYFPADAQRQFLNAHRLFGVSNILKIIRGLDPVQRAEAMRSIIFQSNARAHDPVGGCYRIILELERQLERDQAELALVLRQLAICRAQAQAQAQAAAMAQANPQTLSPDLGVHPNLLLTANDDGDDAAAMYANHHASFVPAVAPVQQQQYYNYFYYDGGGDTNNNENNDNNNSHSNSNSVNNNNNNNHNGLEIEVPQSAASMLSLQQQCGEDDVKPAVDMFEVRQAFAIGDEEDDSKDVAAPAAFHCSTKVDLKDDQNPMEHVQEHDLKGAASLFTLTNCNTASV